jgi:D-sedoheptulose 7-phosphate isomerase
VGVIEQIIDTFINAGERENAIFTIRNGGSAAAASHLTNDISIGTRAFGVKPFKAISLSVNIAVVTAIANDEGYANVFIRQ